MDLDDEICCCYHVPLRKLINFARLKRPGRASQMSECFNAGTGCGWCIPILKMIHDKTLAGETIAVETTPEEHARRREEYRRSAGPRNAFDGASEVGPA